MCGLYCIAHFLHEQSPEGPPGIIVENVSKTKAVYIIGTTLHVHLLHLRKRDKLNLISLTTHFCLVDEVRIHSFEINHFISARHGHIRITPSRWEAVEFVLLHINRGPLVEHEGKRKRAIQITFTITCSLSLKPGEQASHMPNCLLIFLSMRPISSPVIS